MYKNKQQRKIANANNFISLYASFVVKFDIHCKTRVQ